MNRLDGPLAGNTLQSQLADFEGRLASLEARTHKTVVELLAMQQGDAMLLDQLGTSLIATVTQATHTPLHVAATHNYATLARWLVNKSPDCVNDAATGDSVRGMRPLHFAARAGSADVALILLDNGADMRVQSDIHGYCPIHYAAQNGKTALVALLQTRGAEGKENFALPCETAREGYSALHLACLKQHWDVAQKILQIGGLHSGHLDRNLHAACAYLQDLTPLRLFPKNPLELALLKGDLALADQLLSQLPVTETQHHLEELFSHYPKATYGPMFDTERHKSRILAARLIPKVLAASQTNGWQSIIEYWNQ